MSVTQRVGCECNLGTVEFNMFFCVFGGLMEHLFWVRRLRLLSCLVCFCGFPNEHVSIYAKIHTAWGGSTLLLLDTLVITVAKDVCEILRSRWQRTSRKALLAMDGSVRGWIFSPASSSRRILTHELWDGKRPLSACEHVSGVGIGGWPSCLSVFVGPHDVARAHWCFCMFLQIDCLCMLNPLQSIIAILAKFRVMFCDSA